MNINGKILRRYGSVLAAGLLTSLLIDSSDQPHDWPQNRRSYDRIPGHPCEERVIQIKEKLHQLNITKETCQLLDPVSCSVYFQEVEDKAVNAHLRYELCTDVDMFLNMDTKNKNEADDILELENPVGFSIATYNDPRMIELTLSSIYRKHHYYCIHIDSKATEEFKETMKKLVECTINKTGISNIFIANKSTEVIWGGWGVFEADKICMEELVDRFPIKFYTNLAGSEMPRYRPIEIITRGLNYQLPYFFSYRMKMEHRHYDWYLANRWKMKPIVRDSDGYVGPGPRPWPGNFVKTEEKRSTIPYGLTVFVGWRNFIASRDWAVFFLHHPVAVNYTEWTRSTLQ